MKRLTSGRSDIALHELQRGDGHELQPGDGHELQRGEAPTLLALHALGGDAGDFSWVTTRWPGRVLSLDFSGHGASGWNRGGSYTAELFAADADAALAEIGEAVLVGSGLGAYVALLVAGARPTRVPAALLLPGRGFEGGGSEPDRVTPHSERNARALALLDAPQSAKFDPLACFCERDLRPPEYARAFADAAQRLLLPEPGEAPPPWWEAARAAPSAEAAPDRPEAALERLLSL